MASQVADDSKIGPAIEVASTTEGVVQKVKLASNGNVIGMCTYRPT
jgi:hypothetical protein